MAKGKSLALGECKWVPPGKRHEIQLCKTGKGKTKHEFKAGTRRPKR